MSLSPETPAIWICRGWPELDPPKPVPHQWMHAHHEVSVGERCSICHATQDDPDRWDGVTDPHLPAPRERGPYA